MSARAGIGSVRKALAVICILLGAGCGRPATATDCTAIFDRIFALEFKEAGFRDAVLERRKYDELARRLEPYLDECRSARLRPGALQCVAQAGTTEAISHHCLR